MGRTAKTGFHTTKSGPNWPFSISHLSGKKIAIKRIILRPQKCSTTLQNKVGTTEFLRGALYKVQGNSHSSLNKKRTFMWNQTKKSGKRLYWPRSSEYILYVTAKSFPSWLYATRVSSENESARPVRYHQHPRAPADLFAESIEQRTSSDILLMNHKYGQKSGSTIYFVIMERETLTLRTRSTRATGCCGQWRSSPREAVQQFAPLLVGRIGPDAGTWRVRKITALDAVHKKWMFLEGKAW